MPPRIGRHLGVLAGRVGDVALVLADALEAQHLAGEQEGVAVDQRLQKYFLDLAEHRAAARRRAPAGADIAHVQHRHLDDGADIEAVLLGDARMADAPQPVLGLADPGVALVGLQRIAAGGDEIDDAVEGLAVEVGIGRGGGDLVDRARRRRRARRRPCRGHAAPARRARPSTSGGVSCAPTVVGLERGAALQHLEAVGRHEDGLGRLVHAVVGAADALRQPAGALRRADMDDEIDVAPVDAEIERRGGDDGAQAVWSAIAASTLRRWPTSSEP